MHCGYFVRRLELQKELEAMEEDMEIEHVFVAHEIDFDYEFDAARFFDFSREETPAEAREAELWFQTAESYPPSPFVAKLAMREDIFLDNVNTMDDCNSSVPLAMEISGTFIDNKALEERGEKISGFLGGFLQRVAKQPLQVAAGITFCSKTTNDNLNSKATSALSRSSTLMKPTASQLAKQSQLPQIAGSRFQKLLAQNNEKSLSISSGVENQAPKRQKLEGGFLHKIAEVKHQMNFVHKAPKKGVTVELNPVPAKLKLTIPREPDLVTAHRAQRIRPKNAAEAEQMKVSSHTFKARPLNRKILDAPSLPLPKRSTPRQPEFQEFHLKTYERAMQQTSASSSSLLHCNDSDKEFHPKTYKRAMQQTSMSSSSSLHCNDSDKIDMDLTFWERETKVLSLNGLDKHSTAFAPENKIRDLRRPSTINAPKHDGLDSAHSFKAQPCNKKIFSSKGDIGVFRNKKQEATVPKEFSFHSEEKVQGNPPIELFSKLSLTSELQPNDGSQLKLPLPASVFRKDSKENILSSFHPELKEKPSMFGGKQIQYGTHDYISEVDTLLSARRSMGVR